MIKKQQAGFTLIELVVVIVILGILAATALPKFVDLRSDASRAAASGIAGGLSSAASINYAGCLVTSNTATTNKCIPLAASTATCSSIGTLMSPTMTFTVGTVPTTTTAGTLYLATNSALTTAGTTCTMTYGDGGAGQSVTFTGFATS